MYNGSHWIIPCDLLIECGALIVATMYRSVKTLLRSSSNIERTNKKSKKASYILAIIIIIITTWCAREKASRHLDTMKVGKCRCSAHIGTMSFECKCQWPQANENTCRFPHCRVQFNSCIYAMTH